MTRDKVMVVLVVGGQQQQTACYESPERGNGGQLLHEHCTGRERQVFRVPFSVVFLIKGQFQEIFLIYFSFHQSTPSWSLISRC